MRIFAAFIVGLVFGLGILISGMANPAKVLNFFDIVGHWDPSLAFVMGGALITTLIGYRIVLGRAAPVLAQKFHLPTVTAIDWKLITGSAVFGLGWGIAGFCPGAALPALGTGGQDVMIFAGAMVVGLVLTRLIQRAGRSGGTSPNLADSSIR